jgi:uncharacterized protein with GYD domain
MATYISTIKFTHKGVEAVSDTTKRAAAFTSSAEKLGVKVSKIYWTLGPTDGLVIFDAPDDESATAAMLQLSGKGTVHTSTVRAFEAADMDKILGKLKK